MSDNIDSLLATGKQKYLNYDGGGDTKIVN